MRYSIAPLALAAVAAARPQGVSSAIAPEASTPAGCETSYDGTFQIQITKIASKRSLESRQQDDAALVMTLQDGVLKDDEGRTGYIAANRQFQFDAPPQAGAIYTSGFSICTNNFLAIGGKTTWYQCLSGDFYNLYDQTQGGQCEQVNIQAVGGGSAPAPAPAPSAPASEQPDGQPTGSAVAPVTQISDGQPQATTAVAPVTQISDGQIQATTATPVAPVTQITDGQIQAPTSTPVAPVTQISDGQIQAPTAPVTQISDGQIQAPYPTGGAPTGVYPTGTGVGASSYAPIATGAAAHNGPVAGVLAAAGALAVALL